MSAEPMRATLYTVNAELMALLDSREMCQTDEQIAECDADIAQAVAAQMRKIDGFGQFLSHLESQAALAEREITRLEARQSFYLRGRDRLVNYAVRTMQELDLPRLEGETVTFTLRRNTPAVEIQDEAAVPGQFKIVREVVTCDKLQIKQAIQHGETVPGAALREPTVSLIRR